MDTRTVLDALVLEIEGHGEFQGFQSRPVQQHKLMVILARLPVLDKMSEAPVFVFEEHRIGGATELGKRRARLEARRDVQLRSIQAADFKGMPLVNEEGGVR